VSNDLTFRIQPLHDAVVAFLKTIPYLHEITVVSENSKDIESEIEMALGATTEKREKMGIAVVVQTPKATTRNPAMPGPSLDPFAIALQVVENVTMNRHSNEGTGKTALDVVEVLLRYLCGHVFAEANQSIMPGPTPFQKVDDGEILIYTVNVQTRLVLKPETI
jgi:hypothetical protein